MVFNSQLRYYDPQYGTDRSYSGNISEWTWKNGSTAAQNTYAFTYDQLSRLDDTKQYVNGSLSNQFVEKGLDYDRNGNILSLQRTANGSTTENLSYTYSGNRLESLSGTTSGTYGYDARGNMTRDGVQNLDIGYNYLDLIEKVERNNAVLANYSYLSDGTKLAATDSSGDGLVYAGSLVYKKQNGTLSLESAGFSNGRIIAGTPNTVDYYVTDHLGSVRTIIDNGGTVKERNDYYPYGMRWTVGTSSPDNRYRYNAKEEQSFVNVPYIDYGFRQYDPKYRLQWNGNDLLAEKTFSVGTAVFCGGNPILYIDPDGQDIYMYYYTSGNTRRGKADPDADAMFMAAAVTRAHDMLQNGIIKEGDIAIFRSVSDLGQLGSMVEKDVANYSAQFGETAEFNLWSHGALDGPTGTTATSGDYASGHQMTQEGWGNINFNWKSEGAQAMFYGCRTAGNDNGSRIPWAQSISVNENMKNVDVYGQTVRSWPSSDPTRVVTPSANGTYPTYMVGGAPKSGGVKGVYRVLGIPYPMYPMAYYRNGQLY